MLTLRASRLPRFPLPTLNPQIQSSARRSFRTMSNTHTPPFFTSRPRHRTISTQGRSATSLFRSYATYGRAAPAYRSAMTVVWTLIGLNSAVFATWQYAKATRDGRLLQFMTDNFMTSIDSIKAGRYYTVLTCAFSHDNLDHFAFNMFGLYTFGGLVAKAGVGGFHLLAAGLGSALVGSLAGLWHRRSRHQPQAKNIWGAFGGERTRTIVRSLGASGLVMGLAGTATCLLPFAPLRFIFIPVHIPLFAITAVYFGIDAYYLDRGQTRTGHAAHIGGAVFGLAYYFSYLRNYGGVWPMLRRAIIRR